MGKLVKASGQWVAKDGTGHAICYYDEEFVMDDAVQTLEQARSILHAGLLTQRMQSKADEYQNFKRWRTCEVVGFDAVKEKAEFSELDKLMLRATELQCVPENIDNYRRPDYKAKALATAIAGAEERQKKAKPDAMQDLGGNA